MKDMKKIAIYLLLFLGATLYTACNDFLDESPDNRTEIDTPEKISKLLVSAYPRRTCAYLLEMSSDNTDQNSGSWTSYTLFQDHAYFWKDTDENEYDSPTSLWEEHYLAIATANQALAYIEQLGNPSSLNAQKGEALICRAFGHFSLANVFCKHYGATSASDLGLPYAEIPETTVAPHYERSTVAELYEKIAADIEAALPLIDDNMYSVPKYHFNKKAAYAFAARFYLYYGQYDKAIQYASDVLGNNPSLVLRDWLTEGKLSNNGSVKTDKFISVENRCNLLILSTFSRWGRIHGPSTLGARYSHNTLIAQKETNYSTGPWGSYTTFHYLPGNYSGFPKVIVRKMNEYFEYTDPVAGTGYPRIIQVVFSTDETLLCRAEAYALSKNYDKAVEGLNTFMRAFSNMAIQPTLKEISDFYANLDYSTPENATSKKRLNPDFAVESGTQEHLIHYILHLRRILTVHEGLRWPDIKRYGIEIYRRTVDISNNVLEVTDYLSKDDPRRALQLPAEVISAGMIPNPRNGSN